MGSAGHRYKGEEYRRGKKPSSDLVVVKYAVEEPSDLFCTVLFL